VSEVWELEWSLGPVQSFIAAARRTRDLWGGSFLLSLLVAEAVAASGLRADNFRVPSPAVVKGDPLIEACRAWREGRNPSGSLRLRGSLPNHVRVAVPKEEAAQIAERMTAAVHELWGALCEAVWERFIARAVQGSEAIELSVREIWDRQVRGFWEVLWVAAPPGTGGLARRKAWRTHLVPEEPGDRCMVLPEYQELSGALSTMSGTERRRQGAFWEAVRQHTGAYDVRPDERLCAPVLVKRLFVSVAAKRCPGLPDASWWPSTLHLALAGWLQDAVTKQPELANKLETRIAEAAPEARRVRARSCLPGLVEHDLWAVDPELLFSEESGDPQIAEVKRELCERIGSPSRFYAIVLADGDRLGAAARRLGADALGEALQCFGEQVDEIAARAHAVVVYAGGDDVLALAPIEGALDLARRLDDAYREAFAGHLPAGEPIPTLSAAVFFNHARAPLIHALGVAHRLLDDEAKQANGRGSVAVSVHRRNGEVARWVRAFRGAQGERPLELLGSTIQRLADPDTSIPSAAFYRTGQLVGSLLTPSPNGPGQRGALVVGDPELLVRLVEVELGRAGATQGTGAARGASSLGCVAKWLVQLMRTVPGPENAGGAGVSSLVELDLDVIPLVQFLLQGGTEQR